MQSSSLFSVGAKAAAVAVALFVLSQPVAASPAAEQFVQTNVQRGLEILNNQALSKDQRQSQFRAFLTTLTDLRRIALYTLGPARRTATPAEQNEFVDAFRDYAFAVYGAEFAKYSGQSLKVTGSLERAPGDELVRTILVDPHAPRGQEPIEVDFRVYDTNGKYAVVDIVVAGLDLAITEQDDFSSFLAQHNNNVKALSQNLRQRAAHVRETGQI
ncbi:MAG TPA: ABC transporter substrate-binding protein [Rhizomicrobium sp.]|nr:ABC transporter substrate-binding protein [Rhizomicrobium sp.]